MGCSAGGLSNPSITGMHTAIDSAWDQSALEDPESSFEVSKWRHLPDNTPGQPNFMSHKGHMLKLRVFLRNINQRPSSLCKKVERKRWEGRMSWDSDSMVTVRL
eukprot:Skav204403  [mRNA]  locus=scaffold2947:246648:246959:- [translate_table: standard]